jgi:hypothetical protein
MDSSTYNDKVAGMNGRCDLPVISAVADELLKVSEEVMGVLVDLRW